jgi:hypothetical protein
MNHSLIILEHSFGISKDGNDKSSKRLTPENFFTDNNVLRLIVVEHTLKKGQVYIASGLRKKFHFSAPTILIPSTVDAIRMEIILMLILSL